MLTGILLANGNISASILSSLFNENLVKEGNPPRAVIVITVAMVDMTRVTFLQCTQRDVQVYENKLYFKTDAFN